MIKNIPSYQEFEKLGIKCITKSFEMLYQLGDDYSEIIKDEVMNEEITKEEYWEHNAISVQTSLIVLFQGIEYLMKAAITKQSALLLIDNNKNDWPTLPEKRDKDFDELQTISVENLLSVFCAVQTDSFDIKNFVENYEELRIKRNKLVHSTGVKGLNHHYIVEQVFFFLSKFFEKEKWLALFRDMFISEPTFGYWDWDIEGANFYRVLNFIENTLTKGQFNKYLTFDIKARRYLCPNCTYWLNKHEIDGPKPKWSFLTPNTPESVKLTCLICDKETNVIRQDCKSCKGNVLENEEYDKLCLTCYNER